jgi:hypothetical protein
MPDRILVINPNSTDAVTRAIDDAMARTAGEGGLSPKGLVGEGTAAFHSTSLRLTALERLVDSGVSVGTSATSCRGFAPQ